METVPIFFTFDKYYTVAAQVAIYSLLVHASQAFRYELYVLHSGLPTSSQKALIRITSKFRNADIHFIDTSAFDDNQDIQKGKSHFSKEIYYKLIAAELFPQYDRIICSDVDVVFMDDISPSYFMYPDEDFCFAGVGQITESGRMNTYKGKFSTEEQEILKKEIAAGYLLMNLKTIRETGMQERMTHFYKANYHRLCLPEQDTMILCCWPQIRYLPMEYVVCNSYYLHTPQSTRFYTDNDGFPTGREQALEVFTKALAHPIQLHYVGERKPWNAINVPRQRVWFYYLRQSGCSLNFLKYLPVFWFRRLRKYNIKRFCRKMFGSIHL